MAELAARHRMKFAVVRAPRLGRVYIDPGDFPRNARRFTQINLWTAVRVAFIAAAWALWLPVLVFLAARHQYAAAIAWALVPSVLLAPWYGWARAILAPAGIYLVLPGLLRGAAAAVTGRHFEWKGRVI
jgi:hypothetical protein